MKNTFYITTTLPYVNADPHLGHALEFVHADIIARYKRLLGQEVFFNIGTDEHGQKILEKATEEGKGPQEYADYYAERFRQFADMLAISYTNFIRTTDSHHIAAAQEFWDRCNAQGDIYKKLYTVKYCVGCELPKTDSELLDGRCPIHSTTEIELREEENYFFRFSKYQDALLKLYDDNPDFILPHTRRTEITKFVERGLQDFSISRLKEKMPWGIGVPGDEEHVMYVWFDALVNYVSAIGWPDEREKFEKWWPVVQMAGKDNLRQQAAMWQAMLFSAGIAPSKQIIIHGFITSGGQKMSKSVGNVVNPADIVKEYGVDALRYYLAREITPFEDGDFTPERFKEVYNANLANGLGNLTSRIMKMATSYDIKATEATRALTLEGLYPHPHTDEHLENFQIDRAMDEIWTEGVQNLDSYIQREQPFKKIKEDKEGARKDVEYLLFHLRGVALKLYPFMPETAKKIDDAVMNHVMPEPLFLRK